MGSLLHGNKRQVETARHVSDSVSGSQWHSIGHDASQPRCRKKRIAVSCSSSSSSDFCDATLKDGREHLVHSHGSPIHRTFKMITVVIKLPVGIWCDAQFMVNPFEQTAMSIIMTYFHSLDCDSSLLVRYDSARRFTLSIVVPEGILFSTVDRYWLNNDRQRVHDRGEPMTM